MNIDKILSYLGFCPSKESAKSFKTKNEVKNPRHKWKTYYPFLNYTGILLIFTGMVPSFFEDTSLTGVTDTIILHGKIGAALFLIGLTLIIFCGIIPWVQGLIRKFGVMRVCL